MSGRTEAAFLSAIKLHVTGNLALIRAAEEELIKNKVSQKHSLAETDDSAIAPSPPMISTANVVCRELL